jgi:hypothetical protein
MRHGHILAIHGVVHGTTWRFRVIEMSNELVAEKVEIHPVGRTASFGAAQQTTVEAARLSQVMHGNSQVEGLQHGRAS